MITAEDFVLELNDIEENKNFKLATVTSLFDNNTAKIQFDGEETASEKQYAYLESYTPKVFDRVLLGVIGGTYVILGKVRYNVAPPTGEELDRYLFDKKLVTMQKGLKVILGTETDILTVNNGATIVGDVGINGFVTSTGLSTSGNLIVSGTSTLVGAVNFNSMPTFDRGFSSSAGYYCDMSSIRVANQLLHTGSYIGFFGTSATAKRVINPLTGTATTQGNFNAINVIVNALRDYGLF